MEMDTPSEHRNVLVVDDDDTFLSSTADLLRRDGYTGDTAPDGPTARDSLARVSYDLLVADIQMPGNERLELVHRVQEVSSDLPVIIVTAYPSIQSAVESVHLPVIAYLLKPFDFSDLRAQVKRGIELSQVQHTVSSINSIARFSNRPAHAVERQWLRSRSAEP